MARHMVHMQPGPNRYTPETITIHVGDEVVWHNDGGTHNAAGPKGNGQSFDTNDVPVNTDSAPVAFPFASGPSGFEYKCTNHHPNMIGHIIVVSAETSLDAHKR